MGHRKTITFNDIVFEDINYRRAKALLDDHEEITFTQMVNMLIEKLWALETRCEK